MVYIERNNYTFNFKKSRKFDDLLDQEEMSKGLKTLIKYIDFRPIKT